ncbi:DUF1149 family protein [Lactobacillus iners]|jgi:hypothetical protein|uniref:DUF1149 domain-containing protein n=2 Tax=Lactobacillus iners TaxID=147802 RepID=C8PBT0_9LACO|nr:DUF1149 family protein [Lactobacillus iners]EFO67105.1 hypothetical protein HMPREF9214_0762 [Lactobacillus iners LactinV 11V1-d]EFO68281.1 hypothetical protein HMPREF9213_0174 [Lactobacillus iners LactinV 09V1-c]EFO70099.1 hypothetical protein HMPREF9211_0581 [Lactobacillus iners LactinV 01V1-a]EFO71721.1 hypothetical protein HMPREF9215_0880 [Lactobacillus iners SPIN 2503V10-D]EEW52229.1 hypothetical protein HMPREF0520_0550 [Lactobacillus iners DSM 13335]
MKFKKMTPVTTEHFHFDVNEEEKVKNEVNVSLRQVYHQPEGQEADEGKDGKYFQLAVIFDVAPAPGEFSVSGLITQIVQFVDYFGDGTDLNPADYQLVSRPLVEEIETLIYQLTQVIFDEPLNITFKSNFDQLKR